MSQTEARSEPENCYFNLPAYLDPLVFFGANDTVLREFETGFPELSITVRGSQVQLTGPGVWVRGAERILHELVEYALADQALDAGAVGQVIAKVRAGWDELDKPDAPTPAQLEPIFRARGKTISPATAGQGRYVKAVEENTIVFGIGPAGTGKTYLAVALAVRALLSGQVRRVILARPAVEAGESLGYLPGTLADKIDPYLRPLYDALRQMLEPEALSALLESQTLEIAPLAYMRGRTLNEAFVILDEAQNTTREQMKMFLTRLGFGSRIVITGDVTQIDLPGSTRSGLIEARTILDGISDIAFCDLTAADVVRHRLVSEIITAYANVPGGQSPAAGRKSS